MEVAVKGKAKRRHLSADECNELSSAGSSSLTQPHVLSVSQSARKSQKGLLPQTPKKRRKCASASSSPIGRQKGINEFFHVTGVLSSSPNKPQEPCSSTQSTAPRALFPKDDPKKDQEDDDDDDDDVSLLASVINPELCTLDEEDIDDASLLSAENIQENVREKEEEVDYLEGITAEMFDEDFETCAIGASAVDKEVEALPDIHFGLLGSSKTLLEPWVCAFQEKYFCYVMGESETVQWVNIFVLKNILKHPLDHIIRNLVILHYNIYYVLHLMENGPFTVTFDHTRHPQINLTGEQQRVLSHDIQRDHVLKIMAFAGTGKTTTLVKYAEQRPHLRFLYVAFNKSVAKEAERRFPSNVECKTVHALAFKEVGVRYQTGKKLTCSMKPFSINMVLPKGRAGFRKSKIVMRTISTFLASTDDEIDRSHVPTSYINKKIRVPIAAAEIPLFMEDARYLWMKMKNVREKSKAAYYMTHDGYLKLWQLSRPCLSHTYDVIFIDEAQDCTPAILDIMLSQNCGKILVGDPHQQIYTFRGAVNALDTVDHTHVFYLTQSFRFGAEIAYVGAAILRVCKKVQKTLVGGNQKGGVSDDSAVAVAESVRKGMSPSRGKTAILSRTNVSVFSEAVKLTDANSSCRIHFVGGIQGIGLERILDLWNIMQDSKTLQHGQKYEAKYIRDPFLRVFAKKSERPFQALIIYADQTEDRELEAKLDIVERYRDRIPELVSKLKSCHEGDYTKADFILGTVHKAKGMEFDTVMVTDDFAKIPASRHNLRFHRNFVINDIQKDEWNLIYVAVTRAKSSLIISESIRRLLTLDGEYFLKSAMPSALIKDNEPLPCSVSNCPNCITPGSAFVMSRRQINCTVGVSKGGALCERCVWARAGPMAFLMTDDVLSMAEIPEHFQMARHHIMLLALF
ncbi:hypothetical protein WMY93_021296 [Mugilogobius chulae]|uniref:DNA 3'-5' helicase n=1 Tax=Mugilogobius chulae TaxID=88201 RepID=A0AAW0NEJ8_9GOBI